MIALQAREIRKCYRGAPVLHDLDLDVPRGVVLALLGPSGCGKTTLLRLIAGFERCDAGRIAAAERTFDDGPAFIPPERRHTGYVPQEGLLFPHLTVGGNVAFGLTRSERRKGRVAEALGVAGLEGFDRRFPHELSGGQQQRAALARALAPHPAIVLLDEPFNGLDRDLRRSVARDVVAVLRQAHTTTILVTHDPEEAFATADLVAVMRAGRIVQCADPATVYGQSADLGVAQATGDVIVLDGHLFDGEAQTVLGTMRVKPSPLANGAARIVLRPEQIVTVEGDGGVPARLLVQSFRGDHVRASVEIGDTRFEIRLRQQADPASTLRLKCVGRAMAFAR